MNKSIRYSIIAVVLLIVTLKVHAQNLSLSDLQTICNKSNWEYVNQYLMNKGWEYYESEKGSTTKYNTITWSLNKSYGDKAEGWFYIYTYEGFPDKISYSVFNKPAYSMIQSSLGGLGYKLTNSEIDDNELTSTYSNSKFILEITTEKREKKDDFSYYDESITAYRFLLIKKSGIYDPDNGRKTDYWYNGNNIKAEYVLKNGKLNGKFTTYYYNGQIEKKGTYINGKESGAFKEYNEEGTLIFEYSKKEDENNGDFKTYYENGQLKKSGHFVNGKQNGKFYEYAENGWIDAEYTMSNDELNGTLIIYDQNKKYEEKQYSDGKLDGKYKKYIYNDDGNLFLVKKGQYENELENGIWTLSIIEEDDKQRVLNSTTYENGIKSGSFQMAQGDSLIFGSYQNDKLNGDYKIYIDFTRMLVGGIIRTDTANMNLLCEGRYYNDLKTGVWNYFDLTGSLSKTGRYSSDKKTGKWSYYYMEYVDNNSNPLPYSGELFLTETYENGIKNGLSERFSSLEEVKYLCDTSIYKNVNPLDTCTKQVYKKEFQSFYYKNGELHGPCVVKDSIGTVIFKGNFLYGKKDGEWLESYKSEDIDNNSFYIFKKGEYNQGKRVRKWKEYANEDFVWQTSNYSNGKLNGDMINHLKNGGTREIKRFKDDFLKELIVYDSTGYTVVSKYEILNETNYSLKVRKSECNEGRLTSSLEYYMKKDEPVLNYNLFEFMFMLKTGKLSDGESGYPDGELILYDEAGDVKMQGKLKKEDKIGIWKYNYPQQGVQIQIEYTNNEPGLEKYYTLGTGAVFNGIFKFTDDENKFNEERKIKDGLRNGATVYYDFNGEKIKKEKYKDGLMK